MKGLFFLVALCFLASFAAGDNALSFKVVAKTSECFFEDMNAQQRLDMKFEVTRGGLLDIKLNIDDPYGQSIYNKIAFFNRATAELNEAEGTVSIVASVSGKHTFCFDNTMSRWTDKVVSFTILQGASDIKEAHEEVAKLEHLGPMVDSVIEIANKLDDVEKYQHFMRVREQNHRDTSINTNSRVQWMAIIESVVLISLSILQLKYITAWFAETGKSGRV